MPLLLTLTHGLEHREMGLNEDMLDAAVFAGLGQDVLKPLQMFADDCAGNATLRTDLLLRILLMENVDRDEQDVLVLVGVGRFFVLRTQGPRWGLADGLVVPEFPPVGVDVETTLRKCLAKFGLMLRTRRFQPAMDCRPPRGPRQPSESWDIPLP